MSATLTQVRQALATTLAATGLEMHAFPRGAIVPPAGVIYPADGDFLTYRTAMGSDIHDLDLSVSVFVQWGEDRSATEALDSYLADSGTQSIYATVNADQTLGGIVSGCAVVSARNHGKVTYNGEDYLAVEFAVEVLL